MRKILSADADAGLQQILHVDDADEYRGAIELRQDVAGVLREVERSRENYDPARKSDLRPVAEIPMGVYLQACAEGWANDRERWRRWANDPENSALRITRGRV